MLVEGEQKIYVIFSFDGFIFCIRNHAERGAAEKSLNSEGKQK
jgi:hypothetical protein